MNIFRQLRDLLSGYTTTSTDQDMSENTVDEKVDKVAYFNKVAPNLFGPQLKELGYVLEAIKNFNYSGVLWSTHHLYVNTKLNLTVDIQQAPYYTDYGFSIFLLNPARPAEELLCNVPHELQDNEGRFLLSMQEKFFSNPEVISMLKGEIWKTIKMIGID